MVSVWNSGIDLILWLQSLGHGLTPVMKFFSFLGEEQFYLLIMPALLWCVDARLGLRVGLLFLLSAGLNNTLKLAFHAPRPNWLNPQVIPLSYEDSFGIPSGHAQNSIAVWGLLASRARERWVWPLALLVTFFIGLSRLYLGVHFPTDLLGGWLFGGLLLWAFHRWEAPMLTWLKQRSLGQQILIAFGCSLSLMLLSLSIVWLLKGWQLPAEWARNAALHSQNHQPLAPVTAVGSIRPAGALFGLASGAIWLAQHGGFQAQGLWWQRVLRYFLGVIGVLVIAEGLGRVLPRGDNFLACILLYSRYALVGAWIAAGAPTLFKRLSLAQPEQRHPHVVNETLAGD